MGSDFDSFDESSLGAFFQSALSERGAPQGPVRLIGKNAGTGHEGSAIYTSGTKAYILGSEESGGAVVLLKYTRPASDNTGLGSLDWQKKIAHSVTTVRLGRSAVITAPDGDVFFAADYFGTAASNESFAIGVFGAADGATHFLKNITPDTATGTDHDGSPITKAVHDVVIGNAIADGGEPVVAHNSVLHMDPSFKRVPGLARIDTETGTVSIYKGYPYSITVGGVTRIAQNSTHYFLSGILLDGLGIMKIDKSSLSLVKAVAADTRGPVGLAASEDRVFAIAYHLSLARYRLYCFSASDLAVLWVKQLSSAFALLGFNDDLFWPPYLAATPEAVYVSKTIIKAGKSTELGLFRFDASDGALVSGMTLGSTHVEEAIEISIGDKVTITGRAKGESFTLNQWSICYMQQPEDFESNFDLTGITDVSITATDVTANVGEVTITSTSADIGATVSDTDYGIKIPEYT